MSIDATDKALEEKRDTVLALIDLFTELWPGADYGPGHIALSDFNLLDDDLDFCIRLAERLLDHSATSEEQDTYKEHAPEELSATRLFFESLKFIPEDWRDIYSRSDADA